MRLIWITICVIGLGACKETMPQPAINPEPTVTSPVVPLITACEDGPIEACTTVENPEDAD